MTNTIPLIVPEPEVARMLSLSKRTLQRMRLEGGGPPYVQLSERRIGYLMDGLREWIAGRARANTSARLPNSAGAA